MDFRRKMKIGHGVPPIMRHKEKMASVGVEPTTFALLARRSNRLS